MPRLPPSLIRTAAKRDAFLPLLLRECRDLRSATNELRWLKEHAQRVVTSRTSRNASAVAGAADVGRRTIHSRNRRRRRLSISRLGVLNPVDDEARAEYEDNLLSVMVRQRSRGKPLQYIIGNQPFGNLEILCRKNVLIPRPETEAYTTKLAELVRGVWLERAHQSRPGDQRLRILDLCSGSGCISLLLHSLLRYHRRSVPDSASEPTPCQILGLDISPYAVNLANSNLSHNVRLGNLHSGAASDVFFGRVDVLGLAGGNRDPGPTVDDPSNTLGAIKAAVESPAFQGHPFDVVVANPPYISPADLRPGGTTTSSVRKYEPRLALVPHSTAPGNGSRTTSRPQTETQQADAFYRPIMQIASDVGAKLLVMEVGDAHQAGRIYRLANKIMIKSTVPMAVEVWGDDGDVLQPLDPMCKGDTHRGTRWPDASRAVVIWRGNLADWRARNPGVIQRKHSMY